MELLGSGGVAHFAEGFGFDLPDALAGDLETDASGLLREFWLAVEEAETLDEDGSLAVGESGEYFAHLVLEDGVASGLGGGFDGGVFEEIAKLALAAVADFGLEGDGVLGNLVDLADAPQGVRPSSAASSSGVGSRPVSIMSFLAPRRTLLIVSIMWTGMRMVRA